MRPRPLPYLFCLIALGFVFSGCEPERRFAWSPEGERALARWEHQLRLVDGEGRVLSEFPALDDDPGRLIVSGFDWGPEGKDFVVNRLRVVKNWSDASRLLPDDEARSVETLAGHLPELLRATVSVRGGAFDLQELISFLEPSEGERAIAAMGLAWARDPDAIVEALAGAGKALEELRSIDEEDEPGFLIHELATVALSEDRTAFENLAILSRSLRGFQRPRCSPDGSFVAVGRTCHGREAVDLVVVDRASGKFHAVAEGVTTAYDWTPDGRGLVCLSPLMEEENGKLMRLRRLPIPGAGGEKSDPRNLAVAFVPFVPRVEVLASGEVLFAGQPLDLPYDGEAEPRETPRLFTVPLDGGGIREVETEPGALPMDLGYFVPSPDGKRIAVVESQTDALAVIDLETGDSQLVSSPHRHWKCRALPAWKNNAELTYAALDPEKKTITWMRWGGGEASSLSKDWPPEATANWLRFEEPSTD